MKQDPDVSHVLLIDRQSAWLERSFRALESAGFSVFCLDTYEHAACEELIRESPPDLVVLSCLFIGPEEHKLINHILTYRYHLLVLATALSQRDMRALFLKGVDDVIDKPYNTDSLIGIIRATLASIQNAAVTIHRR